MYLIGYFLDGPKRTLTSLFFKDKKFEFTSALDLNTKIDGASDEGKQLKKFLAIILGSTDQSYYYIGKGGQKATFIPSLGRLEDLEYYIQPKYREDLNDFVIE